MPELKEAEVQKFDLSKVDDEMDTRMKEVERITDGVDSWADIPEDREGRDRLPKMMTELNMLGKRRDEIVESQGHQDQFAALQKVFKEPEKFLNPDAGTRKAGKGDFTAQFMESDYGKRVKEGYRGGETEFDLKAFGLKATIGEDATQANIDTDYPVRPDRLPTVVEELFQTPNIADLIPVTTTQSDSIEVVTENYTDAAAETNEGDVAPEATLDFTLATEPVRKIPVGIKASAEVLGDVGLMRGLVQNRLRQDVARREDAQLLNGDGVAPNLEGITARAGIQNQNWSQANGLDAFLEAIFRAAQLVRAAFLNPQAAVMATAAWTDIRLIRDESGGAGTGQYLFGPPSMQIEPRVWGLRAVINENQPDHTVNTNTPVLVGDFANSALIARNPNISVGVTDSDASDFLADVLTFKFQLREALIVHRPAGFATVTTTA